MEISTEIKQTQITREKNSIKLYEYENCFREKVICFHSISNKIHLELFDTQNIAVGVKRTAIESMARFIFISSFPGKF